MQEAGQAAASTDLEAAVFILPQLGLRRVRVPDPPWGMPGEGTERGGGRRESLENLPTNREQSPLS